MNRVERGEDLDRQVKESIADLEEQMLDGQTDGFIAALEWWSQFRNYSYGNSRLIEMQKPDAIQMAGFRFWEALGFHVKSGERATWIKAPRMKKMADPDTGEIEERLIGWLAVPVFCISQCQEWPDKQPPNPYKPETSADWEHLYICWSRRLQTIHGIAVREMQMGATIYGATSGKTIWVNPIHDVSIRAMNLIHETCHIAAGHTTREGHEKWNLQEREAQVQAATFVLCRMLGADHPNAANYLLQYKVQEGQLAEHLEMIGQIVRRVRDMLAFKELVKEPELSEAA